MGKAVARNAKRNLPVSEEVLVTMATKVEAPDIKTNAWEKLSLLLTTENICMYVKTPSFNSLTLNNCKGR